MYLMLLCTCFLPPDRQCIALGLFTADLAGCLQLTEFALSCQCFRRHHHQHRVRSLLTGQNSGNGSSLSSLLLKLSSTDTRILFSCTLCTWPKCNLIISSHYLCFLCRLHENEIWFHKVYLLLLGITTDRQTDRDKRLWRWNWRMSAYCPILWFSTFFLNHSKWAG